ncbi:putative C-type lectin domain family 20 member A [Clupea harengus]|uniref:C-type lectin domain family 20 member A n=1 Tax=Clupea harengus TaxID=7950 RepID=A0A6P8H0Q5_CLUHA|nr:putative C-type lectin domain family 20 member A [Clupea harengus]
MTLLLITTLLFSGLCSLSSCVPRQFHVVKEAKNWTEAQRYCREEFTDLATIDNMREMEMLNSTMNEAGAAHAWIGLKHGSSPKWQWSLADRDRENEEKFRKWNSGLPQGTNKNCTVMKGNGKWHSRSCGADSAFICYDGGNSTHPYVLVVTLNKNWANAQNYCRENHTDLASVRNEAENEKIRKVLGSTHEAWIGLFRDAWEWSDGSTSSFRHWAAREPNYGVSVDGFCTQMHSSGQWNDVGCEHDSNLICYEDKLALVLVRQNKTWKEALQYCREHHVDLVSVTSERIQRWVRGRAKGASSSHVWLGLRHSCNLGFWFWVNGETVCYSNLGPGEKTKPNCQSAGVGAVKSGGDGEGEWVMRPETEEHNFICTTEDQ